MLCAGADAVASSVTGIIIPCRMEIDYDGEITVEVIGGWFEKQVNDILFGHSNMMKGVHMGVEGAKSALEELQTEKADKEKVCCYETIAKVFPHKVHFVQTAFNIKVRNLDDTKYHL